MRVFYLPFMILLILSVLIGSCQSGQTGRTPTSAKLSLSAEGKFQISSQDRCPVCGMNPSQNKKSACAVELHNGTSFYTCGTGCLIRTWMKPQTLIGVGQSDIKQLWVQEFFSGEIRPAEEMVFVAGSDFIGPMGRSYAPVMPDDVKTYQSRHGGDRLFRIRELNEEQWRRIESNP